MSDFQKCLEIFEEENFGSEWYNREDLVDSMRSAMIIRLSRHLVMVCVGSHFPELEILEIQEFLRDILARKAHKTGNRQLIDMTHAAAQRFLADC